MRHSGEEQASGGGAADRPVLRALQQRPLRLQQQPEGGRQVSVYRLLAAFASAVNSHFRTFLTLNSCHLFFFFRKDLKFVAEVEEEIKNLVELTNKVSRSALRPLVVTSGITQLIVLLLFCNPFKTTLVMF